MVLTPKKRIPKPKTILPKSRVLFLLPKSAIKVPIPINNGATASTLKAMSWAITVVPIFDPIIVGMAFLSGITPAATNPTTIEVVTDELWMILVTRIPINNPITGCAVVVISFSANPFPKNLKEELISFTLTKNAYRRKINKSIRINFGICFFSGAAKDAIN